MDLSNTIISLGISNLNMYDDNSILNISFSMEKDGEILDFYYQFNDIDETKIEDISYYNRLKASQLLPHESNTFKKNYVMDKNNSKHHTFYMIGDRENFKREMNSFFNKIFNEYSHKTPIVILTDNPMDWNVFCKKAFTEIDGMLLIPDTIYPYPIDITTLSMCCLDDIHRYRLIVQEDENRDEEFKRDSVSLISAKTLSKFISKFF